MSSTDTTPENVAPPEQAAGLLAEFDSAEVLKSAAERVRDEGFTRWDAHSPFPVHGIDRAMGIRPTLLPWLVLGAGITGGLVALLMQWYLNATDYPLYLRGYPHIISGKPLFGLPANIPVTFELIVLFSAIAAFGGTLMLTGLPQFSHAVFSGKRFRRATSDGFFISIESADPKFDESATPKLIESFGATAVEVYRQSAEGRDLPKLIPWSLAVGLCLALLPPLLIAWARQVNSPSPRIHLVQDMDFQPKYLTQAASPLFEDGRATRLPVPATVAQGSLEADDHLYRGKLGDAWATTFPRRVTESMMRRGQERFNIYCSACHGYDGYGRGMIATRALERRDPDWVTPVSLHSGDVRQQPVGQIFNTITHGVRKMPAYGPQIPVDDRWAIVLYVRALQRSQRASIDDVEPEKRSQLQ